MSVFGSMGQKWEWTTQEQWRKSTEKDKTQDKDAEKRPDKVMNQTGPWRGQWVKTEKPQSDNVTLKRAETTNLDETEKKGGTHVWMCQKNKTDKFLGTVEIGRKLKSHELMS